MTTMFATEARNASLQDAAALLLAQHTSKVDVVLPASAMRMEQGNVVLSGIDPIISEDGVTDANGHYRPTEIGDSSIATKMGIPVPYMRTMRSSAAHVGLLDHNVNHWLEQNPNRMFLARNFRGVDDLGIFRNLSSDRYKVLDHYDLTLATLDGLRRAGVEVVVERFDISERGMRFVVNAPSITAYAPQLLRGYRDPITGNRSDVISAGFALKNSETGFGAATIVPQFKVLACSNGMSITKDAIRNVHLGSKMDEGVVRWSSDTQDKALALVTAQVRDAVETFLNVDYMTRIISEMEAKAGVAITNPAEAIKVIAKKMAFSEQEAQGILSHFIAGGQATAGGLMQATTSWAQTIESPDRSVEVEESGMKVLDLAASL